jgi:ABC-type sugar transport system permease subunit
MNNRGQIAAEFVLILPYLAAFLFAFILFVVFCVRISLFDYASFMASRVDRVWPDGSGISDAQVMMEVYGLMPNSGNEWKRDGASADLRVLGQPPFLLAGFDMFGALWDINASVPVASEPSNICAGDDAEDNALVAGEETSCQ